MQYVSSFADVIYISFFFQAEDGIRDLVRSRGLGDVYKRQLHGSARRCPTCGSGFSRTLFRHSKAVRLKPDLHGCLLYTSDAADERSSVDLGGRRILKKKKE